MYTLCPQNVDSTILHSTIFKIKFIDHLYSLFCKNYLTNSFFENYIPLPSQSIDTKCIWDFKNSQSLHFRKADYLKCKEVSETVFSPYWV
jgi:hypothetical protein